MPPVRMLMKVGAANAAVLAVRAAAAASRLKRLVNRMEYLRRCYGFMQRFFTVDDARPPQRIGRSGVRSDWTKVANARTRPKPDAPEAA
ncbi:hypothetical protein D3C86_2008580 [compost metagenome]